MRHFFVVAFVLVACGKSATAPPPPPPPVVNGTIAFALVNCQAYTTAEYVSDSTSLGTELIVPGVLSKSYSVPSGRHSTIAKVTNGAMPLGLWTYRDVVIVPPNGSVISRPAC